MSLMLQTILGEDADLVVSVVFLVGIILFGLWLLAQVTK